MSFYDDASLIMYPSGYKEDKIYSLKPTDGSGDLTFTRASSATRVNAEGLIEEVPVNLLTYSEQFDNAAWTKSNATILSNATTAPNGTATAEKLVENSSNSSHFVGQSGQQLNNTYSIFAKKGERNWILLTSHWSSGSAYRGQFFDLENGVVGTGGSANGNIENVGDGWYRCSIEANSSPQPLFSILLATSDGTTTYLGDGASGVYLWGAQNQNTNLSTYFPTTDRLNVPRIDYTGGGCGKLLLEPQRTNLIPYSEDFSNAAWAKQEITILQNVAISPDGTLNADKIIPSIVSTTHQINDLSLTSSQTCAMSIFAKADGLNTFDILDGSSASNGAAFDLLNGTFTNKGSGIGSMEYYGNGWYRCISVAVTTGFRIYCPSSAGSVSGDGTSGVYIYGAQLEQGSYATSYIPTSGATATRLADRASKTGISSLIGQTEGTLYLDFTAKGNDALQIYCQVRTTGSSNVGQIDIRYQGGTLRAYGSDAGTTQFSITSTDIVLGQRYKCAVRYKVNDVSFYVNGILVGTDLNASFTSSTKSQLSFNENMSSLIPTAEISQAMLFPSALTDDELADLTGEVHQTFNSLATFYGYTIL